MITLYLVNGILNGAGVVPPDPPTPDPSPATVNIGGPSKRSGHRHSQWSVRIDGELYVGEESFIKRLIASYGRTTGAAEAEQPSIRAIKKRARKQAGDVLIVFGEQAPMVEYGDAFGDAAARLMQSELRRLYAAHFVQAQIDEAKRRADDAQDMEDLQAIFEAMDG